MSRLCNAQAVKENEAEALEEARLAVEEIVLTRQQAIELLPRTPSVIEQQARPYNVLRGLPALAEDISSFRARPRERRCCCHIVTYCR